MRHLLMSNLFANKVHEIVLFFPSPDKGGGGGGEGIRAMSKMSTSIICKTIE